MDDTCTPWHRPFGARTGVRQVQVWTIDYGKRKPRTNQIVHGLWSLV